MSQNLKRTYYMVMGSSTFLMLVLAGCPTPTTPVTPATLGSVIKSINNAPANSSSSVHDRYHLSLVHATLCSGYTLSGQKMAAAFIGADAQAMGLLDEFSSSAKDAFQKLSTLTDDIPLLNSVFSVSAQGDMSAEVIQPHGGPDRRNHSLIRKMLATTACFRIANNAGVLSQWIGDLNATYGILTSIMTDPDDTEALSPIAQALLNIQNDLGSSFTPSTAIVYNNMTGIQIDVDKLEVLLTRLNSHSTGKGHYEKLGRLNAENCKVRRIKPVKDQTEAATLIGESDTEQGCAA